MSTKLKKSTLGQLEVFVLLVYYAFKPAYLVDCCMLSREEAVSCVHGILRKHNLDINALCVVLVESDVFIKRCDVPTASLDGVGLPITINVSRNGVSVLGADEVASITQSIDTALDNLSEGNPCLSAELASPSLVAGWFLGYPCLYQADSRVTDKSQSSSALSMVELHKVCILADVSVHIVEKKARKVVYSSKGLEILGFSIPQSILNESPEVEQQLNTKVDNIMQRLLTLQALQKDYSRLGVCDIRLERTVTVVPSIVL